jgi:hypothetical protein
MALGEAYGQTDVMHDPRYLASMISNPNPRIRAQGEAAMKALEMEQQRQFHEQEFNERQHAAQTQHDETAASREEAGRSAHEDRASREKDLESARQMRIQDQQNNSLLEAARTTTDPAESKMLMDQWKQKNGIAVPQATPDPKTAALQAFHGQQPTASASTALAPSTLAGGNWEVGPTTPTGTQLNVNAGRVFNTGAPTGSDVNVNTGEFVPQGREGTINGQPAGQAIAEGAIKTGIRPESPSGTAALAAMDKAGTAFAGGGGFPAGPVRRAEPVSTGLSANPAPREGGYPTGAESSPTLAQTNPTPKETGFPTGAPPFAPGSLAAQPQPNTTPAPGTQFQGPVTATVGFLGQPNAPVPAPANTPPAMPPPQRTLTDEEKRQQQMVGM